MGEKATLPAKIEAVATVGILILAIVAVYYAVEANNKADSLTKQSLELQNITLNFQPEIIPYPVVAWLDSSIYYPNNTNTTTYISPSIIPHIYYVNGSTGSIDGLGWFNFTVNIISPHYGNVTFENPQFEYMNASSFLTFSQPPIVSFQYLYQNGKLLPSTNGLNIEYIPVGYVAPGASSVDFTVTVSGLMFPVPFSSNDPNLTMSGPILLGKVSTDVIFTDMQTGEKYYAEAWSLMYAYVEFVFK